MSRTWSFCTFHSPLKFQPARRENSSGNFGRELAATSRDVAGAVARGASGKPERPRSFRMPAPALPSQERAAVPQGLASAARCSAGQRTASLCGWDGTPGRGGPSVRLTAPGGARQALPGVTVGRGVWIWEEPGVRMLRDGGTGRGSRARERTTRGRGRGLRGQEPGVE